MDCFGCMMSCEYFVYDINEDFVGSPQCSHAQYTVPFLPQCRFDDGDELDATEDYFVMNKSDYLISTRNDADSDDDDDGDDNAQTQWIGVKNNLDKSSIDTWAKDVG